MVRAQQKGEFSTPPLVEMDGVFREEYELEMREDGKSTPEANEEEGDPELPTEGGVPGEDALDGKLRIIFAIGNEDSMWSEYQPSSTNSF